MQQLAYAEPPGSAVIWFSITWRPLGGDRKGQYSIRINDQWRVCFQWVDADALEVEIVDYH
jgi:plasmid maintenance system killer protein